MMLLKLQIVYRQRSSKPGRVSNNVKCCLLQVQLENCLIAHYVLKRSQKLLPQVLQLAERTFARTQMQNSQEKRVRKTPHVLKLVAVIFWREKKTAGL